MAPFCKPGGVKSGEPKQKDTRRHVLKFTRGVVKMHVCSIFVACIPRCNTERGSFPHIISWSGGQVNKKEI